MYARKIGNGRPRKEKFINPANAHCSLAGAPAGELSFL